MQNTSLFSSFKKECDFFINLPENTDVHYSSRQQKMVITGGNLSFFPGAQTTANIFKGHKDSSFIKALNDISRQLHKDLKSCVSYAEDYEKGLSEISDLQHLFTKAVVGIECLKTFKDPETNERIDAFISRVNNFMELARRELSFNTVTKNAIDQFQTDLNDQEQESILMQSMSEIDMQAYHVENQDKASLFDSSLLQSMYLQELEAESEETTFSKMALYSLSLHYNILMNKTSSNWDWWNRIEVPQGTGQIYLGALPIARKVPGVGVCSNDLTTLIQNHQIGAVLSVVEHFEMKSSGYFLTPIKARRWLEAGVSHKQLPTEDFKTMSLEAINEGVEFIHKHTSNNTSVYIHCKAGRGRSALVLACYLIKYHGFLAQDAIAHIQKYRPQAKLEKAKMDTAIAFQQSLSH